MRYERPMIVRRERIAALCGLALSVPSDVNLKENILPVRW
jgi:hypothetical protein